MTILNSVTYAPLPWWQLILICILFGILVFIAAYVTAKGSSSYRLFAAISSSIIAIALIVTVSLLSKSTVQRTRYYVTLDDNVKFSEIKDYNIIEQDGNIYILEEKVK